MYIQHQDGAATKGMHNVHAPLMNAYQEEDIRTRWARLGREYWTSRLSVVRKDLRQKMRETGCPVQYYTPLTFATLTHAQPGLQGFTGSGAGTFVVDLGPGDDGRADMRFVLLPNSGRSAQHVSAETVTPVPLQRYLRSLRDLPSVQADFCEFHQGLDLLREQRHDGESYTVDFRPMDWITVQRARLLSFEQWIVYYLRGPARRVLGAPRQASRRSARALRGRAPKLDLCGFLGLARRASTARNLSTGI
jgi:hypothetical protein